MIPHQLGGGLLAVEVPDAHVLQGRAQGLRAQRSDQRRPLSLQGLDELEEAEVLGQMLGLDQPEAGHAGLHPDRRDPVLQGQPYGVGRAAGPSPVLAAPHRDQQVGGPEDPARLRQMRVAAFPLDGGAV